MFDYINDLFTNSKAEMVFVTITLILFNDFF